MKHIALPLFFLAALSGAAQAACFAGYKAKQDDPLRLHYGVMQVEACEQSAAEREVADRLRGSGWTLLNVVDITDGQPNDDQRANAGDFFLRY